MKTRPGFRQLDRIKSQLVTLINDALGMEHAHAQELQRIEPSYRNSARNFLHYLGIRQRDIRALQHDLSSLGLTSLGVLEPHVLASLKSVISVIELLTDDEQNHSYAAPVDFRTGPLLLRDHARALLGPEPQGRCVRIMVTMPGEAATNPQLVQDLLTAGMDIMRINCAHDGPEEWVAMVENLRRAERVVGRSCRVQADLAGPKLRTGSIASSGKVLRVKPRRDSFGRVSKPGRVWISSCSGNDDPPVDARFRLCIGSELVGKARVGDQLCFTDTRHQSHSIRLVEVFEGNGCVGEIQRTAYLQQGCVLSLMRGDRLVAKGELFNVPDAVLPISLLPGDHLILTRDNTPGRRETRTPDGGLVEPARIHCTLGIAFEQVHPGHGVFFDDGKIAGIVKDNDGHTMTVQITQTGPNGAKLRAEKGINFPDSNLQTEALTQKDLHDLALVCRYVDMVALSFLRGPEDVERLHDELYRLDCAHLGVVLKIENRQAFKNLPRVLLASLSSPPVGVMIARGDLAVEMGFERLSEVQEEILWLCEAAHVPVIWATQILEGMAKGGAPSRAEVSDAAMSIHAECAMLNKGPCIVETVRFLSGIIGRMDDHYLKRRATLRKLAVARM